MTEIITPEPKTVATAFLVVLTDNGWEATPDINLPVRPEREATVPEMKWGCAEVVSDIEASKVSAVVIQQQLAMSRQMAQAAESQAIRDKLKI